MKLVAGKIVDTIQEEIICLDCFAVIPEQPLAEWLAEQEDKRAWGRAVMMEEQNGQG
jgi:hypothetical protein